MELDAGLHTVADEAADFEIRRAFLDDLRTLVSLRLIHRALRVGALLPHFGNDLGAFNVDDSRALPMPAR
jgi:hypothetical protein